jgi:hypothetical protein
MKGKKGYSFGGWIEGILMSMVVVIAFGIVLIDMNDIHGKSYTVGLGTDSTITAITNLQSQIQNKTVQGEAKFGSVAGITLSSSWDMIVTVFAVVGDFLGGNWITTILGYMMIPSSIALIFRILFWMSIAFIIMKILFKVRV